MSSIKVFDETGNVVEWNHGVKTNLLSKGYIGQLLNTNKPVNANAASAWNMLARAAMFDTV